MTWLDADDAIVVVLLFPFGDGLPTSLLPRGPHFGDRRIADRNI
jgi:hypothetical protein